MSKLINIATPAQAAEIQAEITKEQETIYTLSLTNAQRIMLRRLLRENIGATDLMVVSAVRQKNFAMAESFTEDRDLVEAILSNVRKLQN
jgi:hypothetical protein